MSGKIRVKTLLLVMAGTWVGSGIVMLSFWDFELWIIPLSATVGMLLLMFGYNLWCGLRLDKDLESLQGTLSEDERKELERLRRAEEKCCGCKSDVEVYGRIKEE